MTDLTNWKGVPFPKRKTLDGRYARLEPLDVGRHGADIFAAMEGADSVWAYLPAHPPEERFGVSGSGGAEHRVDVRDPEGDCERCYQGKGVPLRTRAPLQHAAQQRAGRAGRGSDDQGGEQWSEGE